MNQIAKLLGIFAAGAAVGAVCAFAWLSSAFSNAQETVSLAERTNLQEEAFSHYKNGDRNVALYTLTRALKSTEDYALSSHSHKRNFWDVGVLHARLAKVYFEIKNSEKSNLHLAHATDAFAKSGWKLKAEEVFPALELIDNRKASKALEQYGTKN